MSVAEPQQFIKLSVSLVNLNTLFANRTASLPYATSICCYTNILRLIYYTFHASVFDMPREIISKCIWYGDRFIQG
jgi:hypothetical protein